MATKTWKIGEYCKGGIITVETTKKQVTIIGKEWDMSKGCRRSSDQSNAKEWTRKTVQIDNRNIDRELNDFLCDLSTSYYADEIMKWIESKIETKNRIFW